MAPALLFDISDIDCEKVQHDAQGIEAVNPHRGCMRLLDGIVHCADDYRRLVAFKDVRNDEFWCEGHIPGRPIFPGVLQLEAAAQLSSFSCLKRLKPGQFMGFTGVDDVKFRGQVVPGDRLVILCQEIEFRPRRMISLTQGLVNGNLVFEAKITGMPI